MGDHAPVFPADEFRLRAARLQDGMADSGIDTLLLTQPADIFYLTGFLTRFWESPARPWYVILPAKGDPVAVIPAIGADLMGRCWVSDIRTWDAPNPVDDGVSLLTETLADLTAERGAIGLPMGAESHLHAPLADFDRVRAGLGARRIVDATVCVRSVREVKSEAEIDRIRRICGVADDAFEEVPEIVAEDPRLDRIFRQFQMALLEAGADWVSYLAGGAGPDGYGDVISPAPARPVVEGDILMLDTGAVKDGYFCDFDRNFAIGPPTDAARRAQGALWRATEAALDALRPGMTAREAHGIMADAIRAEGAEPGGGRFGHGLGITLTEWPSLSANDPSILRENMVLTLEPSVVLRPGCLIVHEENIVLRADGPELLSRRAPLELPVIAP